ncbi:arsenite methyltransferase [Natranaerofaba carboxydovora]|uniref:arsenite methyltransferase n=1 Tax=Natranaerofaba carboxydovora TaxID=2742683 RepID=UPI001F13942C|nr:arsenite methyltransferase [Natranaerofaba carboxydovora]UMZ72916.1 Malonyl-[acyl-carrier protein] O-methyltransferase [Natranaerofaba carboxydovora]
MDGNKSNDTSRDIKKTVSEAYGKIAKESEICCGPSCCDTNEADGKNYLQKIGYTEAEIKSIPEEANLSLGCGNPTGIAELNEGEVVLDLGSGAGVDCLLAAAKVGEKGRVIGVDMTPEMIAKARKNAEKHNYSNVEFRLGEIENLPLADNSVDVVISNCVINLSADKSRVFEEIYRVLKPGGRISISDIALSEELPKEIKNLDKAYVSCIAGAILIEEYDRIVTDRGFKEVMIIDKENSACVDSFTNDPVAKEVIENLNNLDESLVEKLKDQVVSIDVKGKK